MKRLIIAIFVFLFLSNTSFAAHIIGGEMRYVYLGPGSAPNTKSFRIIMVLFRGDDPSGAALAPNYVVGIFNNDNGQKIIGTAANNNWLISQDPPGTPSVPIIFPSCIQNAPTLNYTYAIYTMVVELPNNSNGYTVAYQTCCRINGMVNVGNSTGSTYACSIPGSNQLPVGNDSSPQFSLPVNVICRNAPFTLNFSATDPDGDSLSYSLCSAYNGGAAINAGFQDPAPPPYSSVSYNTPFTGANPLGTGATINPQTGVITGLAPDFGKYVVSVCISVFRNGVQIATHRKDLIVQVSDCELTTATPMPDFITCDGFNVQFSHTSTGANSVFWDFGDLSTLADTSNINNPSYTYTDTGTYTLKFVINRGTSCSDSAYRTVKVYPGFFPGFIYNGSCFTNPYQFTDTTNTRYGVVDSWRWDFGDGTTLADTSRIRNPQYTYPSPGTRDVRLIVTNSKGCIDTAIVTINVLDKPLITLAFKDTLICVPDAVTLSASGTGSFNWTPLTNIINPNTPNPTVNPATDTWYVANLNDNGCVNKDSVRVRVISGVSLTAIPDTTICLTDGVMLNAVTNGLNFTWTPAATLSNPNILNPIATPTATSTVYQLTARVGSCSATDFVVINTDPYPVANAGSPQVICYNTSTQLSGAHNGTRFTWAPANYLNNPNILNPIASPPRTTSFILTSWDDTPGCPKPGYDTVVITVQPKVRAYAGRDTTVIVGQPLQLSGSGGVRYLWTPNTGLNNPNIADPVAVYGPETDTVKYKLTVWDDANCPDSAFLTVTVFKTNPYVFVPTAFTPNNDGRNDVIRPIAVGIQKINYFSIYNHWGERVFYTTANRAGWDGKVNGTPQASGVYVWMVSAVDYLGKPVFLKGTVTLIR